MLTVAAVHRACKYHPQELLHYPNALFQVLLNMLEYGMNPQEALDAPRFLLGAGYAGLVDKINLEEGIDAEVIGRLKKLGHDAVGPVSGFDRAMFGRGQVIALKPIWTKECSDSGLWAGSDLRADGCALRC